MVISWGGVHARELATRVRDTRSPAAGVLRCRRRLADLRSGSTAPIIGEARRLAQESNGVRRPRPSARRRPSAGVHANGRRFLRVPSKRLRAVGGGGQAAHRQGGTSRSPTTSPSSSEPSRSWSPPRLGATRCPWCPGRRSPRPSSPTSSPARVSRSPPARCSASCTGSALASDQRQGGRRCPANRSRRTAPIRRPPGAALLGRRPARDRRRRRDIELIGDFQGARAERQPRGEPDAVRVHDFMDLPRLGASVRSDISHHLDHSFSFYIRCPALGALRSVPCARCPALGALRSVPCARCPALGALRSVPELMSHSGTAPSPRAQTWHEHLGLIRSEPRLVRAHGVFREGIAGGRERLRSRASADTSVLAAPASSSKPVGVADGLKER